ncbi:hypothetical protein BpHYR1_013356 [Brachionus plicatilis]|uniref:Uncharacterized protein n=1 Tax=Brachionus plicatilis TaxID=10195 RepID=A0A3M7QTR2_BRAPC|nr:hypothetical protein BpHYR1_013356 [Brachionus plicatilis]
MDQKQYTDKISNPPAQFPIFKISECSVINSIKNKQKFEKFIEEGVETEYISFINDTKNEETKEKPWKPSKEIKFDNKNLSGEQKKKLGGLIDKYWMCFSRNDEDIGTVADKYGMHDIKPIILAISKEKNSHNDLIEFVNRNFDGLTPPIRHNKRVGECIKKVNKDGRIIIYLIERSSKEKYRFQLLKNVLKT